MNATHTNLRRKLSLVGATALAAGLFLGSQTASAGVIKVKARPAHRAWTTPVYQTQARVITVPAVYETRPRRIWHEPVYEVRKVLVTLPAKVVARRVPEYGFRGRVIGYTTVRAIVRPARKVWREERVLVREGYYETVYERVLIKPATTRTVYERVLVTPGHWVRPKCDTVQPRQHHGHRQRPWAADSVRVAARHGF